ncbi:hypothetical protein EJ06DRAFT_552314 [Trichodelitschia bisporula]|uniref:Uncharacterized protein n=1 Tax=Trichodelitschia bisporula TaxID=703511 RepID=A0A6G1I9P4_9PEZI|nr:hypothetical protein EJ06DRAFT_552314 [Trichodelitschia bisporula]
MSSLVVIPRSERAEEAPRSDPATPALNAGDQAPEVDNSDAASAAAVTAEPPAQAPTAGGTTAPAAKEVKNRRRCPAKGCSFVGKTIRERKRRVSNIHRLRYWCPVLGCVYHAFHTPRHIKNKHRNVENPGEPIPGMHPNGVSDSEESDE